ncbi:MAG: hypothetical protein SFV54_15310 [Bryobacteraceae bacterium]|nr:hypothetical protein [Bryobacteraceae bacterium]
MLRNFAFSIALVVGTAALGLAAGTPVRPKAGPVEVFPLEQLKPGMAATAWTVFEGAEPEAVPIEIIGRWRNMWGPGQDVILAKMGGKAARTGAAGGMSGSPVYIDGKLLGAVSLRIGAFSPDTICGITPIGLMLEINELDATRPAESRQLGTVQARAQYPMPGDMLQKVLAAGANALPEAPYLTPIEAPVAFTGFHPDVLKEFGPLFSQMGLKAVQGGAGSALKGAKPVPGWQKSLQPGDAVSGVLVSGDMSLSALGTVTYNDGKRVLAFGHPFLNLGPVDMPMSKSEVLWVFASSFSPNKMGNATEIVGSLRQDRHSGVMGELGRESEMVPVEVTVRSLGDGNAVKTEKKLSFNVFVHQKWTPQLMMITLFNSILGLNDFAEEATYRLSGQVELDGQQPLAIETMMAPTEAPIPVPLLLAGYWADKFNRLYGNAVRTPKLKKVNAVVDLLPERRTASIETAWLADTEVAPGSEVPVKVFLRPYRGGRVEREFKVKIPAGLPKGEHRILLSDADTLNRMQMAAGAANRFIDLNQTVSLINQERSNNKLYVSLVESRPTVYFDDKKMPSLPGSVMNVMQTGRSANRAVIATGDTAREQMALAFDQVISGSYTLRVTVK